jgi:hypothetical protein
METISRFPPINSIKSSIQRFKTLIYPVGLLNQSDLDSTRFKLLNGPNILLHRNIRTENEILLILGNPEYIREFTNDNEFSILMDGTFTSSSKYFTQFYTIHSAYGGKGLPLLFCFLDGKTDDAYISMLTTIKNVLEERYILFKPKKVQIDFEYATFNAISRVFPEAVIK